MTPLDLAIKYMDCVFKTGNFDQLRQLFTDDLQFRGPFYSFNNADDYVNSLREDPPVNFEYEIIRTYIDNSSVCLVYLFSKPGIKTTMIQTFDIIEDKIKNILLVFDTGVFRQE